MAAPVYAPHPAVARLCHALHLDPSKTERIVIEVKCGDIIRVYTVQHPDGEQLVLVADAFDVIPVESVTVGGDSGITVVHKQP